MKVIAQRIALLALLLGSTTVGSAQTQEASPAPAAAEVTEAAEPQQAAFPVRDTEPRLQRAYLHVFLAFGIAWVLLLVYALTLGSRFKRLERDLERFTRN